jgi:hypothetical protein
LRASDSVFEWLKADLISNCSSDPAHTFFHWLLAAALWLMVAHSSKLKAIEPDSAQFKPFLVMTETSITFVILNLLFAFF